METAQPGGQEIEDSQIGTRSGSLFPQMTLAEHLLVIEAMTNPDQVFSTLDTAEQADALLTALSEYRDTLSEDSIEARQLAGAVAKLRLLVNLQFHVVRAEPIDDGGRTKGKQVLTFADGTQALFKPKN